MRFFFPYFFSLHGFSEFIFFSKLKFFAFTFLFSEELRTFIVGSFLNLANTFGVIDYLNICFPLSQIMRKFCGELGVEINEK